MNDIYQSVPKTNYRLTIPLNMVYVHSYYTHTCIMPSFPFRWSLDAECNAAIGDPDVNGDTHIYGPTDIDAR